MEQKQRTENIRV